MKYISVIVLICLMSWTWCLATSERVMSLSQHRFVEQGVEDDIRVFIQQKYPTMTELFCKQLYTQDIHPGRELIVNFRCQAAQSNPESAQNAAEQTFEGFLKLKSEDNFQTWTAVGGEIRASEVRFLHGSQISPDNSGTPNGPSDEPSNPKEAH